MAVPIPDATPLTSDDVVHHILGRSRPARVIVHFDRGSGLVTGTSLSDELMG